MKSLLLAAAAASLCTLTACSSTRYADPDETETLTIDFGSTDLQSFARRMADSLLASPNLKYVDVEDKGADKRPIAVFAGIDNETREHINTAQIFRDMQPRIIQSGEMRMVAGAEANGENLIAERVRFEQDSGRVDPTMAAAFGKQLGADVVVYGVLSSIYKEKGRSLESGFSKRKDLYYQFSMYAVNSDTAEILWTETTDINKEATVSLFGRG